MHSWLYRIATNVCLDMLKSRKRRAGRGISVPPSGDHFDRWDLPCQRPRGSSRVPDVKVLPATDDPGEEAVLRSRSASPSSPRCRSSRLASGRC